MGFPKARSCLPAASTAPHSLGDERGGIVLVGDRVININYAKQPLQPTLVSTTFQDGGETEAESIYSRSRSLPVRTSLSKGSCNWRRSSRAEFGSLRYDKIF